MVCSWYVGVILAVLVILRIGVQVGIGLKGLLIVATHLSLKSHYVSQKLCTVQLSDCAIGLLLYGVVDPSVAEPLARQSFSELVC